MIGHKIIWNPKRTPNVSIIGTTAKIRRCDPRKKNKDIPTFIIMVKRMKKRNKRTKMCKQRKR